MTDLEAKARETAFKFQALFWHPDKRTPFEPEMVQEFIATALREARNAALEESAVVVRDLDFPEDGDFDACPRFIEGWGSACAHATARLRSMKGET